jgi:hypothetical protein
LSQHKFKAIALPATLALVLTALVGAAAAEAAPPPPHSEFRTSVPAAAEQEGFANRLSVWAEKDGVLQVGLTSIHGNELAALKKHLGPDVEVFQQGAIESAVKKTPIPAPVPVKAMDPAFKKSSGSATATLAASSLTPSNIRRSSTVRLTTAVTGSSTSDSSTASGSSIHAPFRRRM